MRTSLALTIALFAAGEAGAGHGLINSFAGLEWLPDPGVTPDARTYPLDLARERAALLLAPSTAATAELLRAQALERLAELDAMVRADQADAARRAIAGYADALGRLEQVYASAPSAARDRQHAEDLLAHQYMLSTNYLDLPRGSRVHIGPMMTIAREHYARLRVRLSQRTRDALFFKEEEVRWSWDMAIAGDEQGL
jgi:hypothetical protein